MTLTAIQSLHPVDHHLWGVDIGQVAYEPRAIEIRIGANLEIDLGALGDQTERVIEVGAVTNHRTEYHFVECALRSSQATRHPGFGKHGNTLEEPARTGFSRCGEILIPDRQGVIRCRRDLATKQLTVAKIL